METAQERQQRIPELESRRAERRGLDAPPRPSRGAQDPIELGPGRGDLTRTSGPFDPFGLSGGIAGGSRAVVMVGGRNVSFAQMFAEQPWVAAAVMRMLTWAVRVPLKAYERTGDDSRRRLRPDDDPVAAAIADPWEGGFPAALTMALLGPLLVHGNSVTAVDEGRSGVIRFDPKDWRYLLPISAFGRVAGWREVDALGRRQPDVSADTAMHVAWWSPLGACGVSPLQQLGTTLGIEDAAQRYQRALFRNGARPPSAITASEDFLGLEQPERDELLAQLRDDITALYGGPENQGRPALLPPGLDWKVVGHTAVEAALIDQRYVDRDEVAAVYQIPPPSLGDLRHATYSNITELRQVAYTDALGPPLVLAEQVMTALLYRRLLRQPERYVEFDFAGVLRGDRLKEIQALRFAIGTALMTPNEGRAVLNEPRSDDPAMDRFYLPFNNLAEVGTPPARRQAPAPPRAPAGMAATEGGLLVAERHVRHEARETTTERTARGDPEPVA